VGAFFILLSALICGGGSADQCPFLKKKIEKREKQLK
jgi:hypothetical protein